MTNSNQNVRYSDNNHSNTGNGSASTGEPGPSILRLAAEQTQLAHQLRTTQIPHHVGMAAAGRALAIELPRVLAADLASDLGSGALARRWAEARAAAAAPGCSGEYDSTLFALVLLLRDHNHAVLRHIVRREQDWSTDAYRFEGQANALEAATKRLAQATEPPPVRDAYAQSARPSGLVHDSEQPWRPAPSPR